MLFISSLKGYKLSSPILEALPAIHVTVIGVVAAFFSAFAIYAYQKVNDAKEKLDSALKQSINLTSPSAMRFGGGNRFVTGDGNLDWDENGKELLRQVTSFYSYLDYEEKYGIPRSEFQREPNSEEVIKACDELFLLLSTIFTTYPFWNNNMVHVQGQTEKVVLNCNQGLDLERIHEMQRIVGYLCWTWSTSSRSIITLARKGVEFKKNQQMKEQTEMFEKQAASIPESERERIWKQFHQPHVSRVMDFESIFVGFFEKAHLVQQEVIPTLLESLTSFTTYNQTFKVKDTTLKVIMLIAFNLVAGVMLPLIILNLLIGANIEWSNFWFSSFEYFLLLVTMFPYLWVIKYLFNKVKNLDFA